MSCCERADGCVRTGPDRPSSGTATGVRDLRRRQRVRRDRRTAPAARSFCSNSVLAQRGVGVSIILFHCACAAMDGRRYLTVVQAVGGRGNCVAFAVVQMPLAGANDSGRFSNRGHACRRTTPTLPLSVQQLSGRFSQMRATSNGLQQARSDPSPGNATGAHDAPCGPCHGEAH